MSSCPTGQDGTVYVSAYRGDDVALDVTFYDSSGAHLNLEGWMFRSQLRDASGTLLDTWEIDDDTYQYEGLVKMTLPNDVTSGLSPADYDWDLQAQDDDSTIKTVVIGKLRIKEDVSP